MVIKRYFDWVLSGIFLFLLITPQRVWDYPALRFSRFDFLAVIIVSVITIWVFVSNLRENRRIFVSRFSDNIWILLFGTALALAVITSVNTPLSLHLAPRWICGLLFVYIIDSIELDKRKIRRIFTVIAMGVAITAIYAIVQRFIGVEPNRSFTDLYLNPNMPGRVDSFFGNPNVYGFALMMLLPVIAGLTLDAFERKSWKQLSIGLISFILGSISLVMTYSRGSWVAFAGAMFVFVLLCKPKWLPFLVLLGLLALIPANIRDRFFTIFNFADTSIEARGILLEPGLEVIRNYPFFGAGLGFDTLKDFVNAYYWNPPPTARFEFFSHTHNLFIQIGAEMGLVGLITLLGVIFHGITRGIITLRKRTDRTIKIYISSLIAGMFALLIGGFFDHTLSFFRILLIFFVLLGILKNINIMEV